MRYIILVNGVVELDYDIEIRGELDQANVEHFVMGRLHKLTLEKAGEPVTLQLDDQ